MRLLVIFLSAVCSADVAAHPVPRQHHERTVFIRLTELEIAVEYTLAVDANTLLEDLVPFRNQIDFTGDERQLYDAYPRIYGKRLAEGLVAGVDGEEVTFTLAGHSLKVEDHLRYVFQFRANWPKGVSPQQPHAFRLTDSNFAGDPGLFRMAARSEGRIQLKRSNVGTDPEKAQPIAANSFDQEQVAHTAKITFVSSVPLVADAVKPPALNVDMVTPDPPSPPAWSLRRLLDPTIGLPLPFLLLLAFAFGAVHALQPGHGKTLVAAYLVGQQGTIAHAFYLGLITTLTHTSVVILLAIILPLCFPSNRGLTADVHFGLALGCGILVTLLAFWLLLKRLSGQPDHVHLFGGHHHHHGSGHHHHPPIEPGEKVGWWALTMMGMTGGLVPCIDALGLLTASWVAGQLTRGLPLILAFSLGLASVLVLMGVLVVKFRRFAQSKWGEGRLVHSLPILSAVATLLLGIWMCYEAVSIQNEPPPQPPPVVSAQP